MQVAPALPQAVPHVGPKKPKTQLVQELVLVHVAQLVGQVMQAGVPAARPQNWLERQPTHMGWPQAGPVHPGLHAVHAVVLEQATQLVGHAVHVLPAQNWVAVQAGEQPAIEGGGRASMAAASSRPLVETRPLREAVGAAELRMAAFTSAALAVGYQDL